MLQENGYISRIVLVYNLHPGKVLAMPQNIENKPFPDLQMNAVS